MLINSHLQGGGGGLHYLFIRKAQGALLRVNSSRLRSKKALMVKVKCSRHSVALKNGMCLGRKEQHKRKVIQESGQIVAHNGEKVEEAFLLR